MAFNKRVWIPLGLGTFSMSKYTRISKCPICNKIAKEVDNCGFWGCVVSWYGMLEGSDKEIEESGLEAGDENFLTFKNTNYDQVKWDFLDVTTKELHCGINDPSIDAGLRN